MTVYLIIKNGWNDTIRGHWEGILKTDRKTYDKPKYLFDGWYSKIMPIEQIGNYSVWDFARYGAKPLGTSYALLIFEIDENEKVQQFVFNTSYLRSPFLFSREYGMRNVVVRT